MCPTFADGIHSHVPSLAHYSASCYRFLGQGAYRVQKVHFFAALCRIMPGIDPLKSMVTTPYSDLPTLKSGVRIPFPAPAFLLVSLDSPSQRRAAIIWRCTSNHPPFGCFDLVFIRPIPSPHVRISASPVFTVGCKKRRREAWYLPL